MSKTEETLQYELEIERIKELDRKLKNTLGGTAVLDPDWKTGSRGSFKQAWQRKKRPKSRAKTSHIQNRTSITFAQRDDSEIRKPQKTKFFTFRPDECREIDRNNLMLVRRLASIALRTESETQVKIAPKRKTRGTNKSLSSNTLNRNRIQSKIESDNRLMAQRLAQVKGTSQLTIKNLKRDAKLQQKYASQCSMYQRRLRNESNSLH